MRVEAELKTCSDSPEATQALARCLASALRAGDCLALVGDLGAGKTCFVQGLAAGLGVRGRVASPTFIVMRRHPGPLPLFHADAYRLGCPDELVDVGLEDWLSEGVVAVEWADQASAVLPADRLTIHLTGLAEERTVRLQATGPRSQKLLEHLRSCVC